MDYSRIKEAVDISLMKQSKIVIVGAGGSYSLICSFARMGVGNLTVLDFDTVEASNIVRQGYEQSDIGEYKVVALENAVKRINPKVNYQGITKNFHDMNDEELDDIFQDADLLMFLTDSFNAQAFGNILALRYNKPAIWAGWYAKSRTSEVFFQIPNYTPACFRCAASSRYKANEKEEIKVSSNCNTIFHSQLLDSLIGFIALPILHKNYVQNNDEAMPEFAKILEAMKAKNGVIDYNFFQFKVHPNGGNKLFDNAYKNFIRQARIFTPYFQKVEPELKSFGYDYDCPDCQGKLHHSIKTKNT